MLNRERYIRYCYIIKANRLYTFVPVLVLIMTLWGCVYYSVSRLATMQLFQIVVPYMGLFWILPIKEERMAVGWGELLHSLEGLKKIMYEYIVRNTIYISIFAGMCCCSLKRIGSLKIFFVEVVFQIIMVQGIGIMFLYFSKSMFMALLIPFLFSCASLMLLALPVDSAVNGYICEYEVGLADFFRQQWFYLIPGIGCNVFLLKG